MRLPRPTIAADGGNDECGDSDHHYWIPTCLDALDTKALRDL
jgi:hypothetical protein